MVLIVLIKNKNRIYAALAIEGLRVCLILFFFLPQKDGVNGALGQNAQLRVVCL